MTVQHITGAPFTEVAQVVVRCDEDYEMNNQDDVVDVFDGMGVVIKLPKNPVYGQTHRILAPVAPVTVNGNGHGVQNNLTIVPQGVWVDYTFSSAIIFLLEGGWIASCCAQSSQTPPQ